MNAQPEVEDWAVVAAAVKGRRRELDLSQGAAAKQAGISINTWGRIESGKPVRLSNLTKVAEALSWSPAKLLNGELEPRMPRPEGPALVYVTQGSAPMVCQVDADEFDPGGLPHWDRAVCRALLDLALTKIERHEQQAAAGVTQAPEAFHG